MAPQRRADEDHNPITITLKPEVWPEGCAPPTVRLRRFLKVALRYFGFRCTSLVGAPAEVAAEEPSAEPAAQ